MTYVIKHVGQYKYLGFTTDADGKDNKDILNKIGKGQNIIETINPILWSLTKET